jgi:hypothetical protein
MPTLLQDLRFAFRMLGNSKSFTAVAIVSIGANTAIFSFFYGILLKPLPYPDADRIVRVLEKPPGFPRNGTSTLSFHAVNHFLLARHGGIAPAARRRSLRTLTLAEREDEGSDVL